MSRNTYILLKKIYFWKWGDTRWSSTVGGVPMCRRKWAKKGTPLSLFLAPSLNLTALAYLVLSSIIRQFKDSQQINSSIVTQIVPYFAHWSLITTQVPNFNNILDRTALNPLGLVSSMFIFKVDYLRIYPWVPLMFFSSSLCAIV